MAREPPVDNFRPPDQSQQWRHEQKNKTHQELQSNSSYNFMKSRHNEAMNIAISEKELEGIQKIISSEHDMVIQEMLFSGKDYTSQDLQHTKKSGDEVHLTKISSKMDGPIAGDKETDDRAAEKTIGDGGDANGHYSSEEEIHLTNISINLGQEYTQKDIQASLERMTFTQQVELEEATYRAEANQQGNYEQHEIDNKSQSKNLKKDANQAGKSTNSTSSRSAANLSNIDDHAHVNARGKKSVILNDQTQGRGDTESQHQIDRNQSSGVTNCQPQVPNHGGNCETNSYHKEFPKISSNFDKHTIPNTKGQQTNHPQQAKGPSNPNENQSTKQDQNAEPAPYTVVQTLAARLRQIHATQANSIELVLPKHTDMLKLHLPKEA
ncbi:hypothetical protein KY285_026403 [Solanum tuberosum]|nr:hypothetical protein KY285_026403 [Solanum tuberosum]